MRGGVIAQMAKTRSKGASGAAGGASNNGEGVIFTSPLPAVSIPEVDLYSYIFHEGVGRVGAPATPPDKTVLVDGVGGVDRLTWKVGSDARRRRGVATPPPHQRRCPAPCGCVCVSAQELRHHVDALASGLHERGFRPGDVLGIFAPNHVEYAIALLAAVRLGTAALRAAVRGPAVGWAPIDRRTRHAMLLRAPGPPGGAATTANPTYTAGELRYQLTDSGAIYLVTIPDLVPLAHTAITGTKARPTRTRATRGASGLATRWAAEADARRTHTPPAGRCRASR